MSNCGGPTQEDEENPAIPLAPLPATTCVRCSLPPVLQVRTTSYCHECFLDAFRSKFRRGMEGARTRSRLGSVAEQENEGPRGLKRASILLAFSGGPSSRALLDLVQSLFPPPAPFNAKYTAPPLFSGLEVVYVDESGVPGYGGMDRTAEVRTIVEATGFPFVPLKLEDVFSASAGPPLALDPRAPDLLSHPSSSSSTATPRSRLTAVFAPHSPTSRASLHTSLLHSLLRQTASARSHAILLTGENATRIAIKVLAGMAEGRGFSMAEEVGWEWEAEAEGCMVVRPLNLCLAKEVAYYARAKELHSIVVVNPTTGVEPKKAGIEALTEAFVTGLEASFPSTVSTIIRTAGKLGMRTTDARERHAQETPCPLCGLPAQIGAQEWRKAITISSLATYRPLSDSATPPPVQSISSDPSDPSIPVPHPPLDHIDPRTPPPSHPIPLASLLCYGCLLIFEGAQPKASRPAHLPPSEGADVDDVVLLPPYVGVAAKRRWDMDEVISKREVSGREGMRNIVADFLLE